MTRTSRIASFPFVFSLALLLLAGCATKPEFTKGDQTTGQNWTPSRVTTELAGTDPLEPFNRAMFDTNDFLMQYLVRPFGYVYGSIMPREGIKRIDMVSDNLAFPGRMVSCLLQAKMKGAGTEVMRFLTNTTIGIAGIFDPADAWLGFKRRPENMGHAFASWGIGPGCVLVLPFSPANNPRDHVGALFDYVLDIKFIIPYAQSVAGVNRAVNSYESYNTMIETLVDPYENTKMLLCAMRYTTVNDFRDHLKVCKDYSYDVFVPTPQTPEGETKVISDYYKPLNPLTDTMKIGMYSMQTNDSSFWVKTSFWNTDFVTRGKIRGVRFTPFYPEIRYQYWEGMLPSSALVILIPGTGSHYKSGTMRAAAEMLNLSGYSVAIISNSMNKNFAEGANLRFPGYVPDDVDAIRKALKMILKDIRWNTKMKPNRIAVAGFSLGGLQTLHLAVREEQEDTLGVDRFVAINPPVNLLYSMARFDEFSEVGSRWTKKEFFENTGDALLKYSGVVTRKYPPMNPGNSAAQYQIGLSPEQSAVLIGLSFRMTIRELLLSAHSRQRVPEFKTEYSYWNRRRLYQEIDRYNGTDYVSTFLLPEQQRKDPSVTLESLNYASGLRSIADSLKNNPNVRVIHNLDDPILSLDDRIFLGETFGEKIVWFDCGGHLGNLFLTEHQAQVKESIGPLRKKD